jgi:hypothetical protein
MTFEWNITFKIPNIKFSYAKVWVTKHAGRYDLITTCSLNHFVQTTYKRWLQMQLLSI